MVYTVCVIHSSMQKQLERPSKGSFRSHTLKEWDTIFQDTIHILNLHMVLYPQEEYMRPGTKATISNDPLGDFVLPIPVTPGFAEDLCPQMRHTLAGDRARVSLNCKFYLPSRAL